ncbi:MAG: SusC/RagA family TonB-linked outer membrane protein [Nonlabens sp.]|nr:SusC/RagA family TonB-linked outer membrane protein [Nonlabens sp.]
MNQKFKYAIWLLVLPFFALAQTITGVVTDSGTSQPLLGVSVLVKGTSNGAATDFDGKYTLRNVPSGAVLVYSYLGYQSQEIAYTGQASLNVSLVEDPSQLDAIVLIGYGSTTKENVTAAQTTVNEEEFNKGAVVSPGQLIAGKVSGVSVIAASGRPGDGPAIRVRAGSTLSANAEALYVVDGIPLDQQNANLNTINPAEIESVTVLKDASATAIYGNRASNGVILITTKRGKMNSDFKIGYDLQLALSRPQQYVETLTGDEFRALINANGTVDDIALLGTANTDWQREIYETGVRAMHNITMEKGFEKTGIRANIGYTNENGTLITSGYERLSLNGSVVQRVNDDLKLTLTVQGAMEEVRNADGGAIGSAIDFDPTQPVFDPVNGVNGFFEYRQNNGIVDPLAPRNPLGLLRSLTNETDNNQIRTNLQADYKIPGIEGLSFNGLAGIDYNEFDNFSRRDANSGVAANTNALQSTSTGTRLNQVLNGRFDYKKDLESLNTTMELTIGSSYQNFRREGSSVGQDNATGAFNDPIEFFNQNRLISAFARATFDINDLLVLSGSVSRDGTSRFSPENRWGTFGGASAALKLTNTDFVQNSGFLSQLKLRGGFGVTGQQDIGSDFLFLQRVTPGEDQASVQIGDQFFTTVRPELTTDLKWEETTQYGVGIDFGFFDDVLTGSVDVYTRDTEDLLQFGPLAAGSLGNFALQNVGSTNSKGIEVQLNAKVVNTENFKWNVGANVTMSKIEITDLSLGDSDAPVAQTPVGGAGFNNFIQEWAVGSDPSSFWVFRQVYDTDGNPLDGVYVDVNGDNVINDEDRVRYKQATPDAFFGFTSGMTYKNLDLNFTLRGAVGGYNHNNTTAARDNFDQLTENPGNWLNNATTDILNTGFIGTQNKVNSSYYIQKADWVKLDNLSLGYTFKNDKKTIRTSITGTNLLTITNYDGLDPEVFNGIDSNLFPRSTSVVLGLGIQF